MAKRNTTQFGQHRKVELFISESTGSTSCWIPKDEQVFVERKSYVGLTVLNWLVLKGYIRHSDILKVALFKDLDAFKRANGTKEVRISLVDSDKNGGA